MNLVARALILAAFVTAASHAQVRAQQHDSDAWLVSTAVLALPAAFQAEAEVRSMDEDGSARTLRSGSNGMICWADRPGGGFRVACYQESLEPFMARGRELTAEGVEGMERQETRWREAREGRLAMPEVPAMVYNLGFPSEEVDPATFDPADGGRLHAVYIPYATPETTGLPGEPASGSEPWLMWPGEPSAHVMIVLPPRGGGSQP